MYTCSHWDGRRNWRPAIAPPQGQRTPTTRKSLGLIIQCNEIAKTYHGAVTARADVSANSLGISIARSRRSFQALSCEAHRRKPALYPTSRHASGTTPAPSGKGSAHELVKAD